MTIDAFVLRSLLDPIQAGSVIAILYLYSGAGRVVFAAAITALASETIIATIDSQSWGEWILPRLISSLGQAALFLMLVSIVRKKRWSHPAQPRQRERSTE
jgi:hypothetical protein